MLDRVSYFIAIADELNITRAAHSLFISQQCLSAYLKDLEDELGTALFFRKPRLELTPAGKIYYNMARQVQLLQDDARLRIKNAPNNMVGELSIGVHSARSALFMGDILECFWREFPQVRINLVDGTTNSFERQLHDNQINMYIGINPRIDKKVERVLLMDEQIYICISDELLRKYFYFDYPGCLERFDQGASLDEFLDVPFIFNYSQSNVDVAIQTYLMKNDLKMNRLLRTNNAMVRIDMAVRGFGACIVNSMRKAYIANLNSTLPSSKKLFLFPVANASILSNIYLVWRKFLYYPRYQERLCEIIQDYFGKTYIL